MSEAVTDCETMFLSLLDDWVAILPGREHIDLELRDVYFPRVLAQMSRKELIVAINVATNVIDDFAKLAENAVMGGMRASWVDCFRDIIDEFLVVADAFWEALRLRTH